MRKRALIERELASRSDQTVLRRFFHVARMDVYHIAILVLMEEVSLGRIRGRQRLGSMDGVKVALNDGEGATTMSERSERVESPGAYVAE